MSDLDPNALQDLYDACVRIVKEDANGDITVGAIEDAAAAILKAERSDER